MSVMLPVRRDAMGDEDVKVVTGETAVVFEDEVVEYGGDCW